MKNILHLISLIIFIIPSAYSQSDRFTQDFQPVRNELTKWDPVRGEWLASSFVAMSKREAIPDRTFPENLTPIDMYRLVPEANRTEIYRVVNENQRASADSSSRNSWNTVQSFINRPSCRPVSGRTNGDPHISSFDGRSYDFQSAGEFVLSKSTSENFEIQARQEPQGDAVSLNTAVALNVAGDRVCIYANEKPDNVSNTALRLNGSPLYVNRAAYFLPHGGIIQYSANSYNVTWPTGETAIIQMGYNALMNHIDVTVQVYPCAQNDLQGLLGNANGSSADDFDRRENLVTSSTTLFDYEIGKGPSTYNDPFFPRSHPTIDDLPNDRRTASSKLCQERGITGNDLNGCIFDNAYLQIPPSPRPVVKDPTQGVVLSRVEKPIRNNNDGIVVIQDAIKDKGDGTTPGPQTLTKPVDKPESVNDKATETVKPTNSSWKGSNSSGTFNKPSGSGNTPAPIKPTPVKPAPVKPAPVKPAPVKPTPVKPGKG